MEEKLNRRLFDIITNLDYRNIITRYLSIALSIILQSCLILYWAQQKTNYFIDELYTFGYAHTFTYDKEDVRYITESEDWKYEEWLDNSILKGKLVVSEPDTLLNQPLAIAMKMLLARRNYMGIMNILMTLFAPGEVNKYPGIIFNLFLFALTQILLYIICKNKTKSTFVSLLMIIMYGFSSMAIGTYVYVRFYAFVILLLMLPGFCFLRVLAASLLPHLL